MQTPSRRFFRTPRYWQKIALSLCVYVSIFVCVLNPLLILEDLPRFIFVHGTFPRFITPDVEAIPGVMVTKVWDGGYEDLVYLTVTIDGTWKMRIHTSYEDNLMHGGRFRVETVGSCVVYDERFPTLGAAITFYRNDARTASCRI